MGESVASRTSEHTSLTRYAWLSIAAAIATMGIKAAAYGITGSVSLLSDAMESIVNVVAALAALFALRAAEAPPDAEHEHGHEKIEYFASGFEGALILAAGVGILVSAFFRWSDPKPLESLWLGGLLGALASVVNFAVARVLVREGKRHGSLVLQADAAHLMSDVWTSVAVLVGLGLVMATGLVWLDPVVAALMALFILKTGVVLIHRSTNGLLDVSLPPEERAPIEALLESFKAEGAAWHALRTRQAGTRRFISVHVLVPGAWSVQRGHDLLEKVEAALRSTHPKTTVFTHLEPVEDPHAYADQELDR